MSRVHRALAATLAAAALPPCFAQQSYVERMDAAFAARAPRVGEPLPDATGFRRDGSPFALRDTRGKLTVLVTGCLT